jgi:response regulator RpfG family c-di-GMP phosphodiesterase
MASPSPATSPVALRFIVERGFGPAGIRHAEGVLAKVREFAQQADIAQDERIARFLNEGEAGAQPPEQALGVTMLSSFVAQSLHFTADRSIQVIGLASLLHDVGLSGMDPKFMAEDETGWNEEDLALYHSHPDKGAKILADLKQVDPAVVQAVLQHHERRGRNGFPHRIGAGSINQVSEIVGLCDELFRLLQASQGGKPIDLKRRLGQTVFNGFSTHVVDAFARVFGF